MFLEELLKDLVKSGIPLDRRQTFALEEEIDEGNDEDKNNNENENNKNTGDKGKKKKKCC